MKHTRVILAVLCCLLSMFVQGQIHPSYVSYIEKYHSAAIDQMKRYHIPASITLAQALLESGAGMGSLAVQANNHFGIKVGMNWSGPYVVKDDDRKGEHFRKYKSVAESYEDHSKFLLQPRYKQLFLLSSTDYKGWAKGLKKCGYATNPQYAQLLIDLIERYDLAKYDSGKASKKQASSSSKTNNSALYLSGRQVYEVNSIPCVKAAYGDTWEKISQQTGVKVKRLLSYNEADIDYPITPGTNIFLKKKAKKAAREYKYFWHKIKPGESMYDISQQYGIRVKYLYKMNFRDPSYQPIVGDLLKVR